MGTQGKHSMQTWQTQIRMLVAVLFKTTKTGPFPSTEWLHEQWYSLSEIYSERGKKPWRKSEDWVLALVLLLTDDGTLHKSLVPLWGMLSLVFSWLTPSPPSGLCANSTWAHYLHSQHPHPLTLLHQEAKWFKGWVRRLWADSVRTPSLPNTVCMSLGKLFKLSVTQFPPLWNEDNNGFQLVVLLWGLSELISQRFRTAPVIKEVLVNRKWHGSSNEWRRLERRGTSHKQAAEWKEGVLHGPELLSSDHGPHMVQQLVVATVRCPSHGF